MKSRKKKVTFNLNVQIYEPNPNSYEVLENEEDENKDNTLELEGKSLSSSVFGEGSASSTIRYPSNHRYYNCSYDHDGDEDEIAYEESDIDEFDDGYDWDDDEDDGGSDESLENYRDENTKQKGLPNLCYPFVDEDGMKNQKSFDLNDAELKSNSSGRDRSMSVLSPVENLSQWKAIKAKVTSSKHRRKENVPSEQSTSMLPLVTGASSKFLHCDLESNALQSKPLLQEVAVDASLSNWLISPSYNVSTTIRCQ